MIGGFLVGCFSVASLAYLTWMLVKTHKNQDLGDGSRGFRTFMIGIGYTWQLTILVFLSTSGKAYNWFQGAAVLNRAGTPYVLGFVLGIFGSALLLYALVNRRKNRP